MNFLARRQARAELKKLLQDAGFHRAHTRAPDSSALWDYGEDALADRALGMSEDERAKIDKISAWYEKPTTRCR